MKLGEALILRADCQKRVAQLRDRLIRSAKVQEGEAPPEDPIALLGEVETTTNQLAMLIQRINKTNSQTAFEGETTIADAIAERDMLLLKRSTIAALVETASHASMRYSNTEIRMVNTIDVAQLQSQVDRLSQSVRTLDTRIQATNWAIDLIE